MSPARRAVLLLAAGHGLAMVDRNLLAVAATPVATSLGLKDGLLGFVLGTAVALPYAAAAVPLGRLADRGHTRALLVGGALLWTVASLLTGLTRTPAELIAARVLLGLGQAAFVPAALALLTSSGDEVTRPGRLALFTSGSTVGRSVALLAGGAILGLVATLTGAGWRWLFVVTALPNLLLIAALSWLPVPMTGTRSAPGAARIAGRGARAPTSRLALYLAAACAPIVAGQAGIAWIPTLFVRLHQLTPAQAGMLVGSVALVAAPAGQLLGGWLGRHWRPMQERPVLVVAAGLWAAVMAFLLLTKASPVAVAALGVVGVNLALGIASFAAIFGWQSLWPVGERGRGNGTFMATVTLVGVGAGPLLTGLLSEGAGGNGAALGRALAITAICAAGVASASALLLARGRPFVKAVAA